MNDQILEGETPTAPAAEPAPEPAPAPAAGGASDERIDRLEAAMSQLTETVRDAATRLTAPQPVTPKAPDEFLNELASDPEGVIRRVARDTFKGAADETLNPTVLQVLGTASAQLLQEQRIRVDTQFGVGTFDEVFKPQLDKDLAQLKQVNPRATADPATLTALVNRLYGGDNFEVLMGRRKLLENAQARGIANVVPTGGVPRLKQLTGDEIPNDVEQFIRDVEKTTGEVVDRKRYAKLYYTGTESGPGRHRTTVVDYLKAIGADADKLKMYGGEKQT